MKFIPLIEKPQNIIFGVLTTGEIFVEVNGQQHTPDEAFYKMAAIQSSTLAHQVRDLELALKERIVRHEACSRQIKINENIINNVVAALEKGGVV